MRKKVFVTIGYVLLAMLLVFCIGYKIHKDSHHELTKDELAAAEVTARLKAEKEQGNGDDTEADYRDIHRVDGNNADMPDSGAYREEEEVNADTDISERFIVETPEVYEDYQKTEEEIYQAEDKWQDGAYQFTSDEVWEMTRITYLENGITFPECDYTTVYLTACVILNRLYDWDECNTVYEVIWQGGQYSTADRYHDYNGEALGASNPDGWAISEQAVWDAINNTDRNPHFQSMGVQGEVYYIDPNTGECFCY